MIVHMELPTGRVQVVDGGNLAHFTMRGWHLVAVVENTSSGVTRPPQVQEHSTGKWIQPPNEPYTHTNHSYVIALDEKSSLALTAAESDVRQREMLDAIESERVAKEATAAAEKAATLAKDELGRIRDALQQRTAEVTETREKRRALEDDLGKVRKAIGDLRYKELTGRDA